MNFVLNIDPRNDPYDELCIESDDYGHHHGAVVYREQRREGDDLYVCLVYRLSD